MLRPAERPLLFCPISRTTLLVDNPVAGLPHYSIMDRGLVKAAIEVQFGIRKRDRILDLDPR
jgi:hypothetical protein